jgi:hypothetical protein
MKKIIVFTLLICISLQSAVCQKTVRSKSASQVTYTNEEIKAAYEGTWKYENKSTGEIFVVELKYLPLVIEQRITTDPTEILPNIVGEYSYVCSSKSVNYLSKMTNIKDMTSYRQLVAIPLSIDGSPSPKSDFRFWDRLYDKYTNNLKITPDVMSGANTHLRWQLGDRVPYPELYMSYPDDPDRKDPAYFDERSDEEKAADAARDAAKPKGFSVPTDVILTKVK